MTEATAGEAERRRIAGRAGVTAAGTLVSRVLGLGREQVLAGMFTRGETDAFFVAFVIPNVLRQLLAEGAVQSAVLPVLAQTREAEGEDAARRFFRAVRGLSLAILAVVTVAGVLAAPWLVELFAAGYRADPNQFERTVTLTRWVFPYIFFMGTAALGVAALNTHQRFVVTAFAPGLLNVGFIVFALLLPGWLGARGIERVLAMAAGALVGGALQVVAQWPSLRRIGYLERPTLDLRHPGVREALRRMGPVLIGIGIYYVDVVLARRFLSELPEGSQSYFGFALRLCDFPQGIFVMALQAATLPSLALLAARGELDEVARTFSFGMRLALFVGLAATALFVALAEPIVVAVFVRGEFDARAAHQTALALMAQGVGIWTVAAVRQLVGVYYALGDTRTPVIVSGLDLVVFISLALALRGPFGHVGVSLAVAGSSATQMLLLWVLLRRRLPDTRFGEIAGSVARTALALAPATLTAVLVARALAPLLSGGGLARLAPGAAAGAAFVAVFLLAARLVRSEELATITGARARRRRRAS
ncbi:MAG: murein biosynthesis integral membrane protein MurJ [Sorangiineae bacterium]|nr:murein biosynthesis integral membrane protein MurJ [Sorangiineae bacterium]